MSSTHIHAKLSMIVFFTVHFYVDFLFCLPMSSLTFLSCILILYCRGHWFSLSWTKTFWLSYMEIFIMYANKSVCFFSLPLNFAEFLLFSGFHWCWWASCLWLVTPWYCDLFISPASFGKLSGSLKFSIVKSKCLFILFVVVVLIHPA